MRNLYLDRTSFRTWLQARQDEAVGIPRTSSACPIATYLDETTGKKWYVDPYWCFFEDEGEFVPFNRQFMTTPTWAVRFIHAIDEVFSHRKKGGEILGDEALYILNEAVR